MFQAKKARRRAIHDSYLEELEAAGMLQAGWTAQATRGTVAFQFFPVLCPKGVDNQELMARLEARNIEARAYFSPACHQHSQFLGCPGLDLGFTGELSRRILSLPLWEGMTPLDVRRVVATLAERSL